MSVFISGNFAHASQDDRLSLSGGNGNEGGLTFGVDYWATSNLLLGLAFSLTRIRIRIRIRLAMLTAATSALTPTSSRALPLSSHPHWFIDGILNGGVNTYSVKRPGVIDKVIREFPKATTSYGTKGGDLFDVQSVQMGRSPA